MEQLTIRELKAIINNIPDDQLDNPVVIVGEDGRNINAETADIYSDGALMIYE